MTLEATPTTLPPGEGDDELQSALMSALAENERLRSQLESAMSLLDDATSGYIGGSRPDIEWDERRDQLRAEIAALTGTEALATDEGGGAAWDLLFAAKRALNFISNTESELGVALESGDLLRAAIAKAEGIALSAGKGGGE